MQKTFFVTKFLFTMVFFMALSDANASTAKAIIYFITGAPVDIQPTQVTNATKTLDLFIHATYPNATFTVEHNSKWKDICQTITTAQLKSETTQKVILIGHSYGAQAGITVSDCLANSKLRVDRLVTLDTIHKLFDVPADVIPEQKLSTPMVTIKTLLSCPTSD